jgi:tetratricopeptide (TPR) repeat protein
MKMSVYLRLVLLAVACFSLAVVLQPRAMNWSKRAQSDNVLNVLFGDGRRLFANHFFTQADVSFHSGYYPSIFDQADKPAQSPILSGRADFHDGDGREDHGGHEHDGHADHDEEAHEKEMALGEPHDWIEAFGRHFIVTEHTELSGDQVREILPWLRISASLDPQQVNTYTVASFWLRKHLGKVKEAEEFLREGLRANPNSPELLFELGCLYSEDEHNAGRARDVWELALRRWRETESSKKEPNIKLLGKITANLGRVEEEAGNPDKAIYYLQLAREVSPNPAFLDNEIKLLRQKKAAQPPPAAR